MTESPTALTEGGTPTGIVGGLVAAACGPLTGWVGRDGGCVGNETTGSSDVGAGVAGGSLGAAEVAEAVAGNAAGFGEIGLGDAIAPIDVA
ncbi:MAG TPA: hypothetical protein VIJ11_04450 [Galbitalea sp.]